MSGQKTSESWQDQDNVDHRWSWEEKCPRKKRKRHISILGVRRLKTERGPHFDERALMNGVKKDNKDRWQLARWQSVSKWSSDEYNSYRKASETNKNTRDKSFQTQCFKAGKKTYTFLKIVAKKKKKRINTWKTVWGKLSLLEEKSLGVQEGWQLSQKWEKHEKVCIMKTQTKSGKISHTKSVKLAHGVLGLNLWKENAWLF